MSEPRTEAGKRLLKLAIEAEADSSTWNTAGYLFITVVMEIIATIEAEVATAPLTDAEWNEAYRAGRAAGITEMVDAQKAAHPLDGLDVERLARAIVLACANHNEECWFRANPERGADAILAALRGEGETLKPERLAPSVYAQGHGKPDRCDEHGDIYRDLSIVGHLVRSHGLTYREFVALQEADRIRGIEPFWPHDHDCDAINAANEGD